MSVREHNRTLARARKRALELEDPLAALVTSVLERAGMHAARNFEARVTDFLTAAAIRQEALTASAPAPTSTMVAVYPRPGEAEALAQPGGEPAGILHVTLAYIGDTTDDELAVIVEAMRPVAAAHRPISGVVGGIGTFGGGPDGATPQILLPDAVGLAELRVAVTAALAAAGIPYSQEHGFCPHISISYTAPPPAELIGMPLHFDELVVARGDVPQGLPLSGVTSLTAAGRKPPAGQPPQWSAPAADEILDVATLVSWLRTKTDPVRLAVAETLLTEALAGVGISFDADNPFVAKILAGTASQIVDIAATTQLNVMRIIQAAYAEGLSIPDTAAAIRAGMGEASSVRATAIARTELAGVVNGGSLAATQIVADATGDSFMKRWLTAPGSPNPRHEDYEGLDQQTVGLSDYFDVGGSQLQYPADPDGPPGDVVNCRCSLVYTGGDGAPVSEGAVPDESG